MPAQKLYIGLALLLVSCIACSAKSDNGAESVEASVQAQPQTPPEIPIYSYRIVHSYPHDPGAFTQGLVFLDSVLYEGTGPNNGRSGPGSSIRKVDLATGEVLQLHLVETEIFGEGIAVFEPTHGSAPKYDGQNKVNPLACILAAKMMLEHIGEGAMADRIYAAVSQVVAAGETRTYDMGGDASCSAMGDAVAASC